VALGRLYLALLIEVRFRDPLMQSQRGARRLEHFTAVDDP
jgi:hypothetical protein